METIESLVLVAHVLAALAIIGLVLIQHGKGADMGSGFGAGASATVFGSGGAGNFLSRLTTGIVIAFFVTSFTLAFFAKEKSVAVRDLGIPVVQEEILEDSAEFPEEVDEGELPLFEDDTAEQQVDAEIPEG